MEASMNRREFIAASAACVCALPRSLGARETANVQAHLFISGTVQGVSFRASTREQAKQRGVTGWVKNLKDGRVEALLQGPKDKVDEVIQWCHRGPPAAKVEKVVVTWEKFEEEFKDFDVFD
jgi:acylphosphatase